MTSVEGKRWLCCDPGETVGWSLWRGGKLLGGDQTPLWEFAHDLQDALAANEGPLAEGNEDFLRPGVSADDNTGPIELVVCEEFRLYPWIIYTPEGRPTHALDFEEFRTVQLIGAITFMCTLHDVKLHKQSAKIKERALAGGAKELFVRPLHENRHQNDSAMHGWFYYQVECLGKNVLAPA